MGQIKNIKLHIVTDIKKQLTMDENKARTGLKATEGLHEQFNKLLQLLGHGNLLYDPKNDGSPSKVPDKCEETNRNVEEVLRSMKSLLRTITTSYEHCCQERSVHVERMLKLDDLLSPDYQRDEKERSPEYKALYGELQKKNADLKTVIDEVRQIFVLINQLSVPWYVLVQLSAFRRKELLTGL